MSECRYPEVQVELIGQDGNAFAILGSVKRALLKNGVDKEEVNVYLEEAMSGDYDNLLGTTARWVTIV
jgi:hypothetical protein